MNHMIPVQPQATLSSPLPGTVMQVLVRDGDRVTKGQSAFIVEFMKMLHVLPVTHTGRIGRIAVRAGDVVAPEHALAYVL